MSEHRWQGYRHEELYDQIHQGPGPEASAESVRRWTELTRALGDIDGGLAAALNSAMSGWEGAAADSARGGLRPLGDWAVQAQAAADLMRDRAEQQAAFVAKARADMPHPVPVTSEDPGTAISGLLHLFGVQSDFEAEEARRDAAEQRAFEVMRTYESSTESNTTTLASFAPPPQVVVDGPAAAPGSGRAPGPGVTISWQGAAAVPPVVPGTGREAVGGAASGRNSGGRNSGGRNSGGRGPGGARGSGGTAGRGPQPQSGQPQSGSQQPGSQQSAAQQSASQQPAAQQPGSQQPGAPRHSGQQPRPATALPEDDQVDRAVTDRSAGGGGFFDSPQTSARPVIGGDPG